MSSAEATVLMLVLYLLRLALPISIALIFGLIMNRWVKELTGDIEL